RGGVAGHDRGREAGRAPPGGQGPVPTGPATLPGGRRRPDAWGASRGSRVTGWVPPAGAGVGGARRPLGGGSPRGVRGGGPGLPGLRREGPAGATQVHEGRPEVVLVDDDRVRRGVPGGRQAAHGARRRRARPGGARAGDREGLAVGRRGGEV